MKATDSNCCAASSAELPLALDGSSIRVFQPISVQFEWSTVVCHKTAEVDIAVTSV